MRQLRNLVLSGTNVTQEGVRQLQAELKGCSITPPTFNQRDRAAPAEFGPFGVPAFNAGDANAR
jgi:hypothetical protein